MNLFAALADTTRLQIFEIIAQGERSVGEINQRFAFTPPTISQHLRVLRDARLVRVRSEGQKRYYTVDQAGLAEIEHWLSGMKNHWNDRLDALETILEEKQG